MQLVGLYSQRKSLFILNVCNWTAHADMYYVSAVLMNLVASILSICERCVLSSKYYFQISLLRKGRLIHLNYSML